MRGEQARGAFPHATGRRRDGSPLPNGDRRDGVTARSPGRRRSPEPVVQHEVAEDLALVREGAMMVTRVVGRHIRLLTSLTDVAPGQGGLVVEVQGGTGIIGKLSAMGLYPGVYLIKRSTQPLRGPVEVQVGATTLVIGFGMARRILVEVP